MTEDAPSHDETKSQYHPELFTVRMWREVLDDHFEWRGKVRHSGSHKECYFRDWELLTAFIRQMLSDDVGKDEILPPPVKKGLIENKDNYVEYRTSGNM